MGRQECILEAFVDFEREVSVVAARGLDGCFAHYGVIENAHRRHILDVSVAPASVAPRRWPRRRVDLARAVLEALDVVGVLCVEMFLTQDGSLLVNELAPRPHNSGHLTIDACVTSQFEQQLRAVCGLPLGSTELLRPAAMANLLGDLWAGGEPDWAAACAFPDVKLHLYGKAEARPGRKMGHLTALAPSVDARPGPRPGGAARPHRRRGAVKVLIIGGNRFVGRDLVWRFLAAGHDVTTFNRGVSPILSAPESSACVGDRTTGDFERLVGGREFDAVVDFAAFTEARTLAKRPRSSGPRRPLRHDQHRTGLSRARAEAERRSPRDRLRGHGDGRTRRRERAWRMGLRNGQARGRGRARSGLGRALFPSTRLRIPMVNGERDYHRRIEGYLWRLLDGDPLLLPDGGRRRPPRVQRCGGAGDRALLGNPTTFGRPTTSRRTRPRPDRDPGPPRGDPRRLGPLRAKRRPTGSRPRASTLVRVSPFSGRWMSFLDPTRAKAELGFRHDPLRHYLEKIVASFLAHPPTEPPESYTGFRAREVELARTLA